MNREAANGGSLAGAAMAGFGSPASRVALLVVAAAIVFVIGGVAPTRLLSEFVLRLGNEGLLLGILALSVAFLMNQAGLVTLGVASVYGGAGYLFSIGVSEWDLTALEAAAASLLIIVVYVTVLGAIIVRANAIAFMMLTFAAGEMISHSVMLESLRDHTGGADGLVVSFKDSSLGMQAADFANAGNFWLIAWTAAWLAGLTIWAVRRSHLGAVLRGVRENEERMRFSGFDTYTPRLIAFVLVNVLAAVCGLLHVLNAGFVSPDNLGFSVSTDALVAALIGGVAGPAGPIFGGLIFSFAQDQFGARGATQLFTGIAVVVFIVLFPRGVAGGLSDIGAQLWRTLDGRRKAG